MESESLVPPWPTLKAAPLSAGEQNLLRVVDHVAREEIGPGPAPVVGEMLAVGGAIATCAGAALTLLVGGAWLVPGAILATLVGALPLISGMWMMRPRRTRPPLDGAVVTIALRRGGYFTAADVVADTGLTFDDVDACLHRLCTGGHLHVQFDEASGALVYRLPRPGHSPIQ